MTRGGLPLAASGLRLRAAGGAPVILDVPHLAAGAGARLALVGPSGSGKTSLLHCLAGIARPQDGTVGWGGTAITALPARALDRWRRGAVGIVFQDFHLVPELDVLSNILLPARFGAWRVAPALRDRAADLAAQVGLAGLLRRRAALLSRGEQQRTALARALVMDPAVILADEPTASLDRDNSDALGDLLLATAARSGATLVVATHDPVLTAKLDRVVRMADGSPAAGDAAP